MRRPGFFPSSSSLRLLASSPILGNSKSQNRGSLPARVPGSPPAAETETRLNAPPTPHPPNDTRVGAGLACTLESGTPCGPCALCGARGIRSEKCALGHRRPRGRGRNNFSSAFQPQGRGGAASPGSGSRARAGRAAGVGAGVEGARGFLVAPAPPDVGKHTIGGTRGNKRPFARTSMASVAWSPRKGRLGAVCGGGGGEWGSGRWVPGHPEELGVSVLTCPEPGAGRLPSREGSQGREAQSKES